MSNVTSTSVSDNGRVETEWLDGIGQVLKEYPILYTVETGEGGPSFPRLGGHGTTPAAQMR